MQKYQSIFILIIATATFLRFFNLQSIPAILNRDEAALAYNGYLLSETGMDEWGRRWPIALESFGDYKLIGYPAILAAVFRIFPETDFWARVPSAASGVLLVVVGYWFARTLKLKKSTALLFSAMLAIAPVFIFYSRVAFEANVALLFFVLSLVFIISDVQLPSIWKKIGIFLCYVAAVLTYNTPLLLGILLFPVIIFLYGYKKWRRWLFVVVGWLVITLAALASLQSLFAQKQSITLFSDEATVLAYGEYRNQFAPSLQPLLGNAPFFYGPKIAKNFLRAFSPRFLVTQGGAHPWHSMPNWGHIFWWQYLLAVVGIVLIGFSIFGTKTTSKALWLQVLERPLESDRGRAVIILVVTGLSLAPASITTDAPHATRSLLFFFFLILLATVAFQKVRLLFSKKVWMLLLIIACISVARFSYAYFSEYPHDQNMFQPGFSQAIEGATEGSVNSPIAVIDGGGYQYILTSWYAHLRPEEYFSTVIRQAPDQIGFRYGQQVGRYHFIAQESDRSPDERILIQWNGSHWEIQRF